MKLGGVMFGIRVYISALTLIFLLLAFFIWPFVAVAFVGGYGFIVWMYQVIAGPPGPPPV